jgi:hypothetical protein
LESWEPPQHLLLDQHLLLVDIAIELKNVITTSDNTGTLSGHNTPHQMPLLSHVDVVSFSSIVVLTPNGQFLDCATIAFSVRCKSRFEGMGHDVSSTPEMEAQIAPLTVES